MTDEQVIRVLATYDGWTDLDGCSTGVCPKGIPDRLPDYLNDLNAMRRVEEKMCDGAFKPWRLLIASHHRSVYPNQRVPVLEVVESMLRLSEKQRAHAAAQALVDAGVVEMEVDK